MKKTRGIVLRTVKYGETSIITDIFTHDNGLATFVAGSVRTAKSRMPMGLFQPMSAVEMVCYWKADLNAMHRLKECRADVIRVAIPFDLQRGTVALFMAEIMRKCLQKGEPNELLFEYLTETLAYLDGTADPISHVPLHFLIHLTGHLGILPQTDDPGRFFDLQEGATVEVRPAHGQYLGAEDTERLVALLETPLDAAYTIPIERAERKQLLNKLLRYYQLHIPSFEKVHSPEVLDKVF